MINLGAAGTLSGSAGSASAVTYTISGLELTGSVEVYKILAQGQLAVSAGTIYTAPGGAQSFVKDLLLCNVTASPVAIALYAGPSGAGVAAGNQIVGLTLPANGMLTLDDTGIKVYDGNGAIGTQMALTLTGDVTGAGIGSIATTLATVNANVGAIGDSSHVVTMTLNAKGQVTAASAVAIAIPESAVTSLVTDLAAKIASSRLLNTTAPITGGGDLSADRTLALTQSGVTAAGAAIKPKDLFGRVFVDLANTSGWAGADVGAWINAAFAYLQTTYGSTTGGVIEIGPGLFNFTTPIIVGVQFSSVILRGAGCDAGLGSSMAGTTLNYTATTGVAMTLGGGSNNTGGCYIEHFALNGTGIANAATGIMWGSPSGPAFSIAGAGCFDIAVQQFGTGMSWRAGGLAYAISLINTKIQNCTTGMIPTGENNVMFGGLIGGCGTGVSMATGGSELMMFGTAFDDQTTNAISITNALVRVTCCGCRFENPSGTTTSQYINITAGFFSMFGGGFQEDNTIGGPATGFIQGSGGTVNVQGTWLYSGGRVLTQAFNLSSTVIAHIDPIIGQSSAGITTLVPAASTARTLDWIRLSNTNSALQSAVLVAATAVYMTSSNLKIPNVMQGIQVGTELVWEAILVKNANGTGAFSMMIFRGANGTTADTADVNQTFTSAGTAAIDSIWVKVKIVFTAIGASGSYFWSITAFHQDTSATGFGLTTGVATTFSGTVASVNTTTPNVIYGLGFQQAAGGTLPTITVPLVHAQAFNLAN